MVATDGSVVGVDVGFSPIRRSSAICRLDWTATTVSWEIARFRAIEPEREHAIAAKTSRRPIAAAAFDGPIRRSFDLIGRYRIAEQMLTRRLRPLIGKPGQSNAPVGKVLNQHANECVRHVLAHADIADAPHSVPIDRKAVVEAFPSSFLGMMIEDPGRLMAVRSDRSDIFFNHLAQNHALQTLIDHFIPGRLVLSDPGSIVNHDDRAAFICALSALAIVAGDFVAVGDDDGWIILPPRRFIQPAQWALLVSNAEDSGTHFLHISEDKI